MAVRLEFLTQDLEEIELATRYWAMDEEGAYLERVTELVPFRDILQSGLVAKFVRQVCDAYDDNQACRVCDGPVRVNGRGDPKKTFQLSGSPCVDCAEAERKLKQVKDTAEKEELARLLQPHIDRVQSSTISYSDLADDDVLILRAINALVAPRLTLGTFSLSDCDELTPMGSDDFVRRLFKKGVLVDDPTGAKPGAYFLQDGSLWFKNGLIRYCLLADSFLGRGEDAYSILVDRKFSDSKALSNLWLDYAVVDVMRYLLDQCSVHNQSLDDEALEKVRGAVHHGLQTYSVAQMWYIMWKVPRDAAALASRTYYSREKATATIPTKIRKQLEIADQEGGISKSWNRPEHHLAGSLGMVFTSLFGVDENTEGAQVLKMFGRIGARKSEDGQLELLATDFMQAALEQRNSLTALEAFAAMIRDGLSIEDAMIEAANCGFHAIR